MSRNRIQVFKVFECLRRKKCITNLCLKNEVTFVHLQRKIQNKTYMRTLSVNEYKILCNALDITQNKRNKTENVRV